MKRRRRAAPPPKRSGGYEIWFANNDAEKGWEELFEARPVQLRAAWEALDEDPVPLLQNKRHHRLSHIYATAQVNEKKLEQWQYEVTAGGRIWYCVDREKKIVWITLASTKHPKMTDR